MKSALEHLHLTDFLLHVSHSDALALLILALTRPAGWVAIGVLAVLWSVWFRVRKSQEEVLHMDDQEKEVKQELPVPTAEPAELPIATPDVSQNLADLARQGIGVKITIIELKPAAR
ncbi:MAG: hypothetical protein M3P06_22290 [Acidobacteriota bacterium]|nr:hypothetical protein [Acidobacteriota bacterium]